MARHCPGTGWGQKQHTSFPVPLPQAPKTGLTRKPSPETASSPQKTGPRSQLCSAGPSLIKPEQCNLACNAILILSAVSKLFLYLPRCFCCWDV